jgi:hypothetical protein
MMGIDELPSLHENFEVEPVGIEAAITHAEVVEDLTSEEHILSPASTVALQDGVAVIKPRPYQTEMVEESLKKNVIVAVS